MNKENSIILFGAGNFGNRALRFFGVRNVYCFADNRKCGGEVSGKQVISFAELQKIHSGYEVIISADSPTADEIATQLKKADIAFCMYTDMERQYLLDSAIPNERIAQWKDKFRGQSCFLIGNGSSLTIADLERIQAAGIMTIGCNFINKVFDKTTWRPDFHCVSETSAILTNLDFILNTPLKAKFIKRLPVDKYPSAAALSQREDVCLFTDGGGPGFFSDDPSRIVYNGHTVMFAMLEFALYMGFTSVYLIGVDNTQTPSVHTAGFMQANHHFYEEDSSELEKRKEIMQPTYYTDDWAEYQRSLNKFYNIAKMYAESKGAKIMNATCGGKLEVFERVDFDKLLAKEIT